MRLLRGVPINNLLCQCVVGSHLEAERLKVVHDVDICTIVRELDRQCLLYYWARIAEFAQGLSTNTMDVVIEVRSGPLKPSIPEKGRSVVQLHLLMYDLCNWERVLRYPGCNRWTRQNCHLKGTRITELVPVPRVSTEAIYRDLCIAIENIDSSTAYCRIYDTSVDPFTSLMCRVKLSDDQCIQMALQAGIFGFENMTDPAMGGRRLSEKAAETRDQFSTFVDRWRGLKRQIEEAQGIGREEAKEVKSDIIVTLRKLAEMADWFRLDDD